MTEESKIRVGIAGGAGYTGGELLRLLLRHPRTEAVYVSSRSQAGRPVSEVHDDLVGRTGLVFTDRYPEPGEMEVLFLCLPHGTSSKYLGKFEAGPDLRIIDLGQDHRLDADADDFIYGLPEFQREAIAEAKHIANPGCFATAIQLALLPLAEAGLLRSEVHVSAITGSTGAGAGLQPTTHFSWRNNNISVYKAFTHQHLREIGQTLRKLQPSFEGAVNFIPYRGNFTRGIIATAYTAFDGDLHDGTALYDPFYGDAPFVVRTENELHLKQVVNTNNCMIKLEKHGDKLMVVSAIDNLLKGASGQAVQNLNLMMGWPEREGLDLKASMF